MTLSNPVLARRRATIGCAIIAAYLASIPDTGLLAQEDLPNACPVDGCEVRIVDAAKAGDELSVTFEANFTPDMARNHIHVWWGESYKIEQVSNNAEPAYGVKQGDWHPTDEYPAYTTQSAA